VPKGQAFTLGKEEVEHETFKRMNEVSKTYHHASLIQTLTVGFGISPNQFWSIDLNSRTITAGREFHPAPKLLLNLKSLYHINFDLSTPQKNFLDLQISAKSVMVGWWVAPTTSKGEKHD